MAKDPAFLFYSADFISGVQDLTMEERGQYISLLCLQHQKGHLSEKMIRLCCGNATADVLHKFKLDENGLFFNERLDIEIEKRKGFSELQRQRALDGWEKRKNSDSKKPSKKKDATANATALPINVNENKDINSNNGGPDKSEFIDYGLSILKNKDYEFSLAAKYDSWVANNWKTGGGRKIKDWKSTLRNTIPFLKPFNPSGKSQFTTTAPKARLDDETAN